MTPDPTPPTAESLRVAEQIVYEGPWPDGEKCSLFPLKGRPITEKNKPNLVQAISHALSEREAEIERLKVDLRKAQHDPKCDGCFICGDAL